MGWFSADLNNDKVSKMSSKLNKASYQGLVDGDIEWLKSQEDCPENWHIQQIVKGSVDYYYPVSKAENLPISNVIDCVHPFNSVVSGDEGDFCCECQKYLQSHRL